MIVFRVGQDSDGLCLEMLFLKNDVTLISMVVSLVMGNGTFAEYIYFFHKTRSQELKTNSDIAIGVVRV